MLWVRSYRSDPKARVVADRHYSRQKPGTHGFVPPGRCLVLYAEREGNAAYWVTSWPFAQYVRHAWAGAWVCSAFRNEGVALSSDMIVDAVAATKAFFGQPPDLGMITFVDTGKTRKKRDPGRCFRKAGFRLAGETAGGLIALRLSPEDMPPAEPAIEPQLLLAI